MQTLDVEILFGILIFIANTFLGVLVFFRNWKSWTNRLYFLLVLQINAYIATNFISLHPELINSTDQLFWIRIVMFVCSLIGPTLLCLIHTFPGDSIAMKKRFALPLFVLMFSSAALSLLPYVFTDLQYVNGEPIPTPGPGIPVFFLDFIGLFIASFVLLYYKWKHSVGLVRAQLRTIAVGTTFSFSLMGISTVIFVVILKSSSFVFLGPLYTVFLMAAIAYAIINYNLFNIKIIATQAFVVIISIIFLARIFISQSHSNRLVDTIILVATILFGYLLIRSVKIEIRSKEEISLLAKRLSDTNWEPRRAAR